MSTTVPSSFEKIYNYVQSRKNVDQQQTDDIDELKRRVQGHQTTINELDTKVENISMQGSYDISISGQILSIQPINNEGGN